MAFAYKGRPTQLAEAPRTLTGVSVARSEGAESRAEVRGAAIKYSPRYERISPPRRRETIAA